MNLQAWSAGMNPITRRVVFIGAWLVAALLLFQLGRFVLSERPTNPAELEALTFYAERVHNAATFSLNAGVLERIPTGDCLTGYTVADTSVTPSAELGRFIESCQVGLDNNDLPVVTVSHRDGTTLSVP